MWTVYQLQRVVAFKFMHLSLDSAVCLCEAAFTNKLNHHFAFQIALNAEQDCRSFT